MMFFLYGRFFVMISLLLNENIITDLVGIAVAHVYYFLADIYPKLPLSTGKNIVQTPRLL